MINLILYYFCLKCVTSLAIAIAIGVALTSLLVQLDLLEIESSLCCVGVVTLKSNPCIPACSCSFCGKSVPQRPQKINHIKERKKERRSRRCTVRFLEVQQKHLTSNYYYYKRFLSSVLQQFTKITELYLLQFLSLFLYSINVT